jgi:hypothetical protein
MAAALADQLAARFNDRQHRTSIQARGDTALVQIGSKHGTPVTVHIADTTGGVLVTMSRDRDWLDRAADASELVERAASNPLSLLALVPDVIGEMKQENLAPQIWNAINDLCALTRSLAGEEKAPKNPKICEFCGTSNDPELELVPGEKQDFIRVLFPGLKNDSQGISALERLGIYLEIPDRAGGHGLRPGPLQQRRHRPCLGGAQARGAAADSRVPRDQRHPSRVQAEDGQGRDHSRGRGQ